MAKLTKAFIDKVSPPAKGYQVHWDDTVKGYGLRVSPPAGPGRLPRRVFIAMGRVAGKSIQFTIGPFGTYTEDQARKRAQSLDKGIAFIEGELAAPVTAKAAASVAAEIRSFVKGLSTGERVTFIQKAIADGDETTVSSLLGAPS